MTLLQGTNENQPNYADHAQSFGLFAGEMNPYVAAFPAEDDFLDLSQLPPGPHFLAQILPAFLTDPTAFFSFRSDNDLEPKLWHLHRESVNRQQRFQQAALHLAFPVFTAREAEGWVCAPVFLWPVQLIPDRHLTQQWVLRRIDHTVPRLNPYVRSRLEGLYPEIPWDQVLANSPIAWLDKIRGQSAAEGVLPWSLQPPKARLQWSPLLGCFPPLAALTRGTPEWHRWQPSGRAPLPIPRTKHQMLLPAQQTAFAACFQHPLQVITGGPASGKKKVLEHILVQALARKEKVLVLSERPEALQYLRDHLEAQQLAHLSFHWTSTPDNRQLLLGTLRAIAEREGSAPMRFDKKAFQDQKTRYERKIRRFQRHYQAVRQPVFGSATWPELTGHYLTHSRLAGRQVLDRQLSERDFTWQPEEYDYLREQVERAQPLFEAVGTLHHPLQALHESAFLQTSSSAARAHLEEQLDYFIAEFSKLQHEYILSLQQYAAGLAQMFDGHYRRMQEQIQGLEEAIQDGFFQYGNDFLLSANATLRLLSPWSRRVRRIRLIREEVRDRYRRLRAAHDLDQHFPHTFHPQAESRHMRALHQEVRRYADALSTWHQQTPDRIRPLQEKLSATAFHPHLHWAGEAERLQQKKDQLLAALKKANLLAQPPGLHADTLEAQRALIEQVLEQLDALQRNMRDFPVYYPWRSFWMRLRPAARSLIASIAQVRPRHWASAFASWYLNQVLHRAYVSDLPEQRFVDREMGTGLTPLREGFRRFIRYLWAVHRHDVLGQMRRKERERYNRFFGSSSAQPTQNLSEADLEAITDLLPVFLTSSLTSGAEFRDYSRPLFDWVLLEGAQYIPDHLGTHLAQLGRRVVMTGNDHFALADDRRDLLEAAIDQGYPVCHLPNEFLTEKTVPASPRCRGQVIPVESGVPAGSVHEGEIEAIIGLLADLPPTQQRTLPQVGIVTLTTAQRDRLAWQLNESARTEDDLRNRLDQFERNGLRILTLWELAGHRFHTLLLSTTLTCPLGHQLAPAQLGKLNTPAGIRQVYELMNCAQREVIVVTTWSQALVRHWSEQLQGRGTKMLARFLQQFMEKNSFAGGGAVPSDQESASFGHGPSKIFLQEAGHRLANFLGKERVQFDFAHQRWVYPVVITGGNGPYVLIPDGVSADTPASDPEWEWQKQEHLLEQGLQPIPLWSQRWWRNEAEEARRVASHILNLDREIYGTH